MKFLLRRVALGLFFLWLASLSFASAYNARPKLIVIIVIDQFRGDYLERYRDQFGEGGFRLFLDHGANFTDCNYNYANTRTAPGHATLLSGAYSDGHGIMANEWWDPRKKRAVTSVQDDGTKLVGVSSSAPGSSPHNLLADTLGDELKLATQGKARVFGIALKDRAAIFSAAFPVTAPTGSIPRPDSGSHQLITVVTFPSGCRISTTVNALRNILVSNGKTVMVMPCAKPRPGPVKKGDFTNSSARVHLPMTTNLSLHAS